jgi:hypothetical protein
MPSRWARQTPLREGGGLGRLQVLNLLKHAVYTRIDVERSVVVRDPHVDETLADFGDSLQPDLLFQDPHRIAPVQFGI